MSEEGIVFGGAVSAICAISCIAAIAVVASIEVDKDGKISFDEELFEEKYKTLVGAYILSLDSGASDSLDFQSLMDNKDLGKIDPAKIQLSPNGIAFIKNYEEGGIKPALKKYDANPPNKDMTIGWGHKIRKEENFDNGITAQQADELFQKDEDRIINTTFRQFMEKNNIQLTQQQFDALVSFTYQNGEYSWDENNKNARQTMIDFVKKGDYCETSLKEAYSAYMGKKQLPGTIKRREDEIEMFLNGDYTRMP